jgi:hypothetical protein
MDAFRIAPIQSRFLKTVQLFKSCQEHQFYALRGGRFTIDTLNSFGFCHRNKVLPQNPWPGCFLIEATIFPPKVTNYV